MCTTHCDIIFIMPLTYATVSLFSKLDWSDFIPLSAFVLHSQIIPHNIIDYNLTSDVDTPTLPYTHTHTHSTSIRCQNRNRMKRNCFNDKMFKLALICFRWALKAWGEWEVAENIIIYSNVKQTVGVSGKSSISLGLIKFYYLIKNICKMKMALILFRIWIMLNELRNMKLSFGLGDGWNRGAPCDRMKEWFWMEWEM